MRFRILQILHFIPDKQMLELQYYIKHKRKLDLQNPQRYTEKLQWYKLYYRDPLMQQCVDKYRVREYVASKGLGAILNELYTVFETPEEITLHALPDKFVMKSSNGSGTNFLCKDKSLYTDAQVQSMFRDYLAQSSASVGREWVYSGLKPVIIVEQYLEDPTQHNNDICDYKFLCFNGQPEYVVYDVDRFTDHKRNIYDTNWNDLHVASDCPCSDEVYEKPEGLDKMLEIARILSADFPAVRVDLYSIQGKIYFGELTFFPWSGYVQYTPDSFDFELGEKFILPEKNNG
ncbi:MAG: ATP-grasp fold amidoligase family protein [Candidatus Fimenecus sp.]